MILLIAIKMKIEVNIKMAGLFFVRIIENSFEIDFSIVFITILLVDEMHQKDVGKIIKTKVILIQLEIIVLEHGSKIENKFLIISSCCGRSQLNMV